MFLSGIFILAWGFNAILATNHIITGGLAGISIINDAYEVLGYGFQNYG